MSMRKPRAIDLELAEAEPDWLPPPAPEALPAPLAAAPLPAAGPRLSGWLLSGITGLAVLGLGAWIAGLVQSLFALGAFWGWLGAALAGVTLAAAAAIITREGLALWRLKKLEAWQAEAHAALNLHSREAANKLIRALDAAYAARPEMAKARASLASHGADIMDAPDRIRLAERELMAPLDAAAQALIANAVKRVTLITAITPSPALDMGFVAWQNLRLMRELASLYGGRPGTLASLRLARLAIAHIAVAGSLALSDQLLQQLLGKGLAGTLSARFGEGAVNGILTARMGLAAADLCRPLPWLAGKKPQLASFLAGLAKSRESE